MIIAQSFSLVTRHSSRTMSGTAPTHAPFDRAAATILGSMITLIAVLSFVLLETSVESNPEHVPMAASVAEAPGTP